MNNKKNQVCDKSTLLNCKCGRWHYIKINGMDILSSKYKKCHPIEIKNKKN